MQQSLTYMRCPADDYLTLEQLTSWLGLKDAKTVRKHILRGHIPEGKPRAGGSRLLWDQQAAAVAMWNLDNLERYQKPRRRAPKPTATAAKKKELKPGMPPENGV